MPGAYITEQHKGGRPTPPTFADVRAAGFLADRVQVPISNCMLDVSRRFLGRRGDQPRPGRLARGHWAPKNTTEGRHQAMFDRFEGNRLAQHVPQEVTPRSAIPHGTIRRKCARSGSTLSASPCDVTRSCTATPTAAIFAADPDAGVARRVRQRCPTRPGRRARPAPIAAHSRACRYRGA